MRVADALHLDSRRAPRFLRTITNPSETSSLHWDFQERLARPHIELDAVVFTTGQPFERLAAEAWWLAYDTVNGVDRELRDVDLLLQSRGREVLKARRVKGAGSPEILSRTVKTRGWRPVDTRLQVSDVPRIVENLGGSRLYGSDPTVALRELIQNAADAVQARRKLQRRPTDWGQIIVDLPKRGEDFWLVVEDNGIGMSEQVPYGTASRLRHVFLEILYGNGRVSGANGGGNARDRSIRHWVLRRVHAGAIRPRILASL